MGMIEYPTLTALMSGREPGSVKVRRRGWTDDLWFRPGRVLHSEHWVGMNSGGDVAHWTNDSGPWLIVSEDQSALDTLRLEIAARLLAGMYASSAGDPHNWDQLRAYALAEADALIKEARK